jgi:stage II sporulation protein R
MTIIVSLLVINKEEQIIIPKESIRFRVIANSNSKEDQLLKKEIVKNLNNEIINIQNNNSITETRSYIKANTKRIEDIVSTTLKNNNSQKIFSINYGDNYFPQKIYKNVVYEEGEYESLVITLGEGSGKNFWCVLFPPLCLVDEHEPDVEYKSIVKEIIKKYF